MDEKVRCFPHLESIMTKEGPSITSVTGPHSTRSDTDGVRRFMTAETAVVANAIHPDLIGQSGQ